MTNWCAYCFNRKLIEACDKGDAANVKQMLDFAAKEVGIWTVKDICDSSEVLAAAAESGNAEVVKIVLDFFAHKENDEQRKTNLKRAVMVAVRKECDDMLDMLLEGADISELGEDALISAAETGRENLVRKLIVAGVDVKKVGGDAISGAISSLYYPCSIVKILIDAGADVNTCLHSELPLVAASRADDTMLMNLLIEAGADIKRDFVPALKAAISRSIEMGEWESAIDVLLEAMEKW